MSTASWVPYATEPGGLLAKAEEVLDRIMKVRAKYGVHDRPDIVPDYPMHSFGYHTLNDETLRALEDVDSGRGVERASTIAEMVKKLDL